ncbi:MAG: SufE family protein, partial [Planctomycetota bacterium]|nr:SufE family protein [Planctomycetota bacterium]
DDDGAVHPHIGVAEEAPTIRGIASILVNALDGCTTEDIASVPSDLVEKLGLHQVLRMNRTVGVAALVGRLKKQAAA